MNPEDKKIFQRWAIHNHLSPNTQNVYKTTINHYIKCTGKSLQELHDEALQEEDEHVPLHRKQVRNYLIDFQAYLDQRNLKESTKRKQIEIITSFYKSLDIRLPSITTNYDNTPDPENTSKMLLKPLIKVMMNNASTRDKAIMSFMALTGQAQMEVANLTLTQLIKAYNTILDTPIFTVEDIFKYKEDILNEDCVRLDMYRQKTNQYYWTYLPAECSQYIIAYLHERMHGTNDKLVINDNDTPVFVTKKGTKFKQSSIGKMITHIGSRCGFDHPENFDPKMRNLLERREGYHHVYKSHNFRKYFINNCRRYAGTRMNDIDVEYVFSGRELADFWVGHKVKGSIAYYLQYNEDDFEAMKKQYLQALPYLSLEDEVRTFDTEERKEFEEMKKNYQDLQKQVEELKEFIKYRELRNKFENKGIKK